MEQDLSIQDGNEENVLKIMNLSGEREEIFMDSLMEIVLKRFREAGIEVSKEKEEAIYWSVFGELRNNGYDAAYKYATTAELN